jgi:hypothetical protein
MSEVAEVRISKIDAARRQLDTAIELWFKDGDGLSAFTLAYASFKLLGNLYTHHGTDGFGTAIEKLTKEKGAHNAMARIANFLKHADRDPNDALAFFHPDLTVPVIGLSTLLYKNLTDSLSLKMQAFDSWTEITAADELGIPETDQNAERAAINQRVRAAPRGLHALGASVLRILPREPRSAHSCARCGGRKGRIAPRIPGFTIQEAMMGYGERNYGGQRLLPLRQHGAARIGRDPFW